MPIIGQAELLKPRSAFALLGFSTVFENDTLGCDSVRVHPNHNSLYLPHKY